MGGAEEKYQLGQRYETGDGVATNEGEASRWYKLAGDLGENHAYFRLANLYDEGRGVPQDSKEALKWYLKAALDGGANSWILFRLGLMYELGRGTEKDYRKAARWYQRASRRGANSDANALFRLGLMHAAGAGVGRNPDLSQKLLHGAARQWSVEIPAPARDLAEALEPGSRTLSPTNVNELSAEAERGRTDAQISLGYLYSTGNAVPKELTTARDWFARAAEQGDARAQFNFAYLLLHESRRIPGVTPEKAAYWLARAVEQGHARSQVELGILLLRGTSDVARDEPLALQWLTKAASQGNVQAIYTLGSMYAVGKGTKTDPAAALRYFRSAAEQGMPEAQKRLAAMYATGDLVERDLAEADFWWKRWWSTSHRVVVLDISSRTPRETRP